MMKVVLVVLAFAQLAYSASLRKTGCGGGICIMVYAPVCGSDGTTYGNMCQFHAATCNHHPTLTVAYQGECDHHHPHGLTSGVKRDLCEFSCFALYDPVCGSDGHTYGNSCTLRRRNCGKHQQVTMAHQGACHGHDIIA